MTLTQLLSDLAAGVLLLALTGGMSFISRLWVAGIFLSGVLLLVHGRVGGVSLVCWLYLRGRFWWLPKQARFRPPSARAVRRVRPGEEPVASQHWVPAGELRGSIACSSTRGSDGRITALTCWAILELRSSSTLRLLPQHEQEQLLSRCQRFLDGLSFPVKFLWIVEPLDPARDPALEAQQQALDQLDAWSQLQHLQRESLQEQRHQHAHCSNIRHLAVVSVSSHEVARSQQEDQDSSLLQRVLALLTPRRPRPVAEVEVERALRIRLAIVKAGLEALDLQVRLLDATAFLSAFASCLAPGTSVPSFEVVLGPRRQEPRAHTGRWMKRLRGLHGQLLTYASPRPQAVLDPGLPLAEVLAPSSVEVSAHALSVSVGAHGQQRRYLRTYEVKGLPAELSYGWLEELTSLGGMPLIVTLHCQPLPSRIMLRRLEMQRTRLESQRLADRKALRLTRADVELEAAQLRALIEALASKTLTLHSIQLLLAVHASTLERLEERARYLLAHLRDQQVRVRALAYRHDLGWRACLPAPMTQTLPAAISQEATTLPSDVVATCLSWSNGRVGTPSGAYLGTSRQGPQGAAVALPVYLNPWDDTKRLPNPHIVICGESGMGKSWLAKTLILGLLCTRTADVVVLDRDGDYDAIHAALGGASQRINLAGHCPINPLELPYGPGDVDLADPVDLVAEHIEQHLLSGLALLYGEALSRAQEAALTHAARLAYAARGLHMDAIRTDPQVLLAEPPTFADFLTMLRTVPTASEVQREMLVERFEQVAYLFPGHTRLTLAPLTIFAIGKLDERWYPFMNYVIHNFVQRYRAVQGGEHYLAYVVEEASYLLKHPAGRRYLEAGARGFRKLGIAQITISQHPADFLEAGQVVLANSGTWFLLGMQRQAAQRLQLPDELERVLEEARPGRVVFRCGRELAPLDVVTYRHSPLLQALLTTDPRDRQRLARVGRAQPRGSL
ncbi:VirB4 family type IV secretion system protein [Thermogemmatispora sp.]|uniref:VirB4 family type IV secretion system protein n=1 Tax=Thermogemmatispora sp. TaxID=1968838 RepID=UPI0035E418D5